MSAQTPSPSVSGIILTGFMGAGKTTAGALLAARLGWRFVDSDRVIEERARRTIAEIFAAQGEAEFRALEAGVIRDIAINDNLVLALGGGALENFSTREFVRSLPGRRVVFLDAPFNILIDRCAAQENAPVRPVLRDRERLADRWQRRLPLYREADLTIPTAGLRPEGVVDSIVEALFPGLTATGSAVTAAAPSGGKR
ncbi:MAG TPA: shikimate kinase [Acidobacteriaceae bacterium]|nr:shikimate kinase [Acidobacteriaceae bacterium]